MYSEAIKNVPEERQLHFDKLGTFVEGKSGFEKIRKTLREGDVVAYHMKKNEARREVLKGNLARAGYRLLDYGHLAILTGAERRAEAFFQSLI